MSFGTTLVRSKYGELLATPASEAQWVEDPTAKQAVPPIEIDRFFRNGQHPNPIAQNKINEQANAAVLYRSKEVFSGGGALISTDVEAGNTSFGAGDRARWRFAFHTGPYTHSLYCVAVLRPPSSGYTSNTYARLDIASDAATTTVVGSQTFVFGNEPTNGSAPYAAGWGSYRVIAGYIDGIAGDTDYYGTFYDVDNGILVCASVFDLQSMTEHTGGYLAQSMTTHTPVLNLHRQLPVDISNALWQKGGAHVLNWGVNDGTAPIGTITTTKTNVIDTTSTGAPTAATPGYTLDFTNKDRLNSGGLVPCVLAAHGKMLAASTGGRVYLVDSSNNVVASIVDQWTTTTLTWKTTTFNMPASVAKYDLQWATAAGTTFYLDAISIYEKG